MSQLPPTQTLLAPGQNLLIDADDTLWQNNIYFEQAIAAFIGYLNHDTYTADEVRQTLNAVEHESIGKLGYGVHSFTHSLLRCFERLSPMPLTADVQREIVDFAVVIRQQDVVLLDHVSRVLPQLAARHRLILVTKGDSAEQADKLTRSGLAPLFSAVEIVPEKDAATYANLIHRYRLDPARSWMIGNSPRSDINPALAVGLNAVFLFHADTWMLEHAQLDPPQTGRTLIELDAFSSLENYF